MQSRLSQIACCITYPYSSWPAVSRTSSRATSSSITHCLRYESMKKLVEYRPPVTSWTVTHPQWWGRIRLQSDFEWIGLSMQTFRHLRKACEIKEIPTVIPGTYRHRQPRPTCILSRIVPKLQGNGEQQVWVDRWTTRTLDMANLFHFLPERKRNKGQWRGGEGIEGSKAKCWLERFSLTCNLLPN